MFEEGSYAPFFQNCNGPLNSTTVPLSTTPTTTFKIDDDECQGDATCIPETQTTKPIDIPEEHGSGTMTPFNLSPFPIDDIILPTEATLHPEVAQTTIPVETIQTTEN